LLRRAGAYQAGDFGGDWGGVEHSRGSALGFVWLREQGVCADFGARDGCIDLRNTEEPPNVIAVTMLTSSAQPWRGRLRQALSPQDRAPAFKSPSLFRAGAATMPEGGLDGRRLAFWRRGPLLATFPDPPNYDANHCTGGDGHHAELPRA